MPGANGLRDVARTAESVSAAPSRAELRRLTSLDALRGVAVLLMIEQHVGMWLWRGPDDGLTRLDYPVLVAFNAIGGYGAPLFIGLAGIGSALMAASRRPGLDAILVRRGLALMGFGLLLNLITPSWFSWGSWFALHLMGFSMALTPAWRRMSTVGLLAAMVGIMAATPIVQLWLGTPDHLDNVQMRDLSRPGGALRLALAEGQYPVLPWMAVFVAGFVAGRWIRDDRPMRIVGLGVAVFGATALGYVALVISGPEAPAVLDRAFRIKLGFFPPSLSVVGLMLSLGMIGIGGVLLATRTRPPSDEHALVVLGRSSLTIFLLHVWLFREASRPLGLWSALAPGPTLAVIGAFAVLCAFAARRWQRVGYRWGAEWMLRRAGGSRG